ncbi:TonB family protein [uncultured Methylobacterium sp.]|uniref:energy transducer TonB family protein n=1 Tax=uncultured Methylobacterium sp. TaxID=157278 RepID=UPI0035C95E1A
MAVVVSTGGGPEPRASGLLPAFLVALALHLAVLAGLAVFKLTPPAPPGEQQVSIDLAPLMTEAETQAPSEQQMSEAAPPETKPVEEPTEAEPTKPPPEVAEVKPDEAVAEPPPVQAVTEAPPDAVPVTPESQVITSTAEQAEPLAPPPPARAQAPEKPVEAKPVQPKPDLAKLKAEREAKIRAAKRREQIEEARREAAEERVEAVREARAKAAREARAKAAPARQGADTRSSASASRQNAAGQAAAGNDPSAMRQWTGAISSAIHSRMNPGAANGTAGGTAMVRFTVLRSGQVTSAGVARSSGVGQIDSAALGAVRGSLPAAPSGVTQQSLSVTIPLNYRVR